MRIAIVAHLFYEEEALDLLARLRVFRGAADLFVTGPGPRLGRSVAAALRGFAGRVELAPGGAGLDVGPFVEVLPRLAEGGYDVFLKLHTKRGRSGYSLIWRETMLDALVGSRRQVGALAEAFADRSGLALAGPEPFYLSAAVNMLKNAAGVTRLARLCFPGRPLPRDWGFFAGTMFWGRVAAFQAFTAIGRAGVRFEQEAAIDGLAAHAMERLFGLVEGEAAVIRPGGRGLAPAPEGGARTGILQALGALHQSRPLPPAGPGAVNPLVHYLRQGAAADFDPNPWFHNARFAAAGMSGVPDRPMLVDYLSGEGRLRWPNPRFNPRAYLARHPWLEDAAIDPLAYYLVAGLPRGETLPEVRVSGEGWWRSVPREPPDPAEEEAFLAWVDALPRSVRAAAASIPVSVLVLPGHAGDAGAAIASALAQTHPPVEVLVAGPLPAAGRRRDARIRRVAEADLIRTARGRAIAFLDPAATWDCRHLEWLVAVLVARGAEAAWAVSRWGRGPEGWTGADSGPEPPHAGAAFDISALLVRKGLARRLPGPGAGLGMLWTADLIRRTAGEARRAFVPLTTVRRTEAPDPISARAHPGLARKLLEHVGLGRSPADLPLRVAIKVATPREATSEWGDTHFGAGLAAALRRLGHEVRVDLRDDWYAPKDDDVVIVLRGPVAYEPPESAAPGPVHLLWVIAHPDQVSPAEMERYDRVFVASESFARLLAMVLGARVAPLLQATDTARFHPVEPARRIASNVLFIGNRRGGERPIVDWAVAAGLEPEVHGSGWDGVLPSRLVHGSRVDNRELPARYAGAGVVLNDHWPAMRDFAFCSNRILDVLAAGGVVVSDANPGIATVCGRQAVAEVAEGGDILRAVAEARRIPQAVRRRRAAEIRERHSFDRRAGVLAGAVLAQLTGGPSAEPEDPGRPGVHVVWRAGDASGFARLVSPLTQEAFSDLSVSFGHDADLPPVQAVVVQSTAFDEATEAERLIAAARRRRTALIVDDAPGALGRNAARIRRLLLEAADQRWVPHAVARSRPGISVVPEAIDPRLWRDYHRPPRYAPGGGLRFLVLVDAGERPELEAVVAALDSLRRRYRDFKLVVAGPGATGAALPERRWIHRDPAPADHRDYPGFAWWLRKDGGRADVGLALSGAPTDRRFLELSALGLLTVAGPGFPLDRQAAEQRLVIAVEGGEAGWREALGRVLCDPRPLAAIAGAATDHVWRFRSAGDVSRQQRRLVGAVVDGSGFRNRALPDRRRVDRLPAE